MIFSGCESYHKDTNDYGEYKAILLLLRVPCMNHALAVMNDHKERFLAASNMSRVETDGVFSATFFFSFFCYVSPAIDLVV